MNGLQKIFPHWDGIFFIVYVKIQEKKIIFFFFFVGGGGGGRVGLGVVRLDVKEELKFWEGGVGLGGWSG